MSCVCVGHVPLELMDTSLLHWILAESDNATCKWNNEENWHIISIWPLHAPHRLDSVLTML